MTVEYDDINRRLTKKKAEILLVEAKQGMPMNDYPAEAAKRRAAIRNLEGVMVYKGANSIEVSSLNAHDHVTHLGWSYLPSPEWLAAQDK